ncbi:MAG: NAD(P)H-binding protein [Bacteroidota bacterium]
MFANQLKRVVIAGAGGLVGSKLMELLIADLTVSQVVVFSSKPRTYPHPKVIVQVTADYSKLERFRGQLEGFDVLYCCVGSTMAKAGSEEAFRKVDYTIPLALANLASLCSIPRLMVISSVGADASSRNFYLRTKGEMERDILELFRFKKLAFIRPSLIIGARDEDRPAERWAQLILFPLAGLFLGRFKKYKPLEDITIAKAMTAIFNSVNNQKVYEANDLDWLGR